MLAKRPGLLLARIHHQRIIAGLSPNVSGLMVPFRSLEQAAGDLVDQGIVDCKSAPLGCVAD
jgi:hypothetical protein